MCTGIFSTDGEIWKEQRRFSIHILREFGVGKSVLADKIHEEMHHLIAEISGYNSQPLDPFYPVVRAVSNIIGSLLFGKRHDYKSKMLKAFMDFIFEVAPVSQVLFL